jgi:N-acetylmuramoyl-L-alanine amidase
LYLLKNSKIPAVIVECGFLSNFEEEQLLLSEDYRSSISEAIVSGIENYYKKEYKQ